MRFLVPASSALFVAAVALSTTAAMAQSTTAAVFPARARSAPSGSTQAGAAPVGTVTRTRTTAAAAAPSRVAGRAAHGWPLSPRPAVLRRFQLPLSQWSPGHRGVDLLAALGQPVLSAGEGVVAFSGVLAGRGVITVRHAGGLRTTYEPVDERLASGTLVHRGTRIGVLSPGPGHCAPRHCLHWGAIFGQAYRDPLSLLSFGRPILLPLG